MLNNLATLLRLSLCLLFSVGVHGGAVFYDWVMNSSEPSLVQVPVIVSFLPASDVISSVLPKMSQSQPSLAPEVVKSRVKQVLQPAAAPQNVTSQPKSTPAKTLPEKTPTSIVRKEPPVSIPSSEMVCMVPQEAVFEGSTESFSESLPAIVSTGEGTTTAEVPDNSHQSSVKVPSDSAALSTSRSPLTEAVPNYRSNPLPEYPYLARQKHWEGVVWLLVDVTAEGLVEGLRVEQSCGHRVLDRAASKAVRRWRFSPAKRAGLPVSSQARIPVRFHLEEG